MLRYRHINKLIQEIKLFNSKLLNFRGECDQNTARIGKKRSVNNQMIDKSIEWSNKLEEKAVNAETEQVKNKINIYQKALGIQYHKYQELLKQVKGLNVSNNQLIEQNQQILNELIKYETEIFDETTDALQSDYEFNKKLETPVEQQKVAKILAAKAEIINADNGLSNLAEIEDVSLATFQSENKRLVTRFSPFDNPTKADFELKENLDNIINSLDANKAIFNKNSESLKSVKKAMLQQVEETSKIEQNYWSLPVA